MQSLVVWDAKVNRLIAVAWIKSRIRETKNLSPDADSRTDTILERLRDLSFFEREAIIGK